MLMNDKIFFGRSYYINSAETKLIMVHYILHSHHIFILVKAFVFMLAPGGLQFLMISMCFAWCPVTSISKSHVLTAHEFLIINKQLFKSCDTGILCNNHCFNTAPESLGRGDSHIKLVCMYSPRLKKGAYRGDQT